MQIPSAPPLIDDQLPFVNAASAAALAAEPADSPKTCCAICDREEIPANHILLPCAHIGFCQDCVEPLYPVKGKMNPCPICQTPVETIKNTFDVRK